LPPLQFSDERESRNLKDTAVSLASAGVFISALSDCVQVGIRNVLGQAALDAVFAKMKLVSLSEAPHELHSGFEQIFGPAAEILERLMVKDLFKRLNLRFEQVMPTFDFETYVNIAKREFSMKSMK